MNSNAFLRSVVAIFIVYAVAAVSILVFYVGDPGPVITPLTATFGMLITALMAKQLSDSNVIQQQTAAKVETVVAKVDSVQEAALTTAALTQQVVVAQETLAQATAVVAQETTAIGVRVDSTHSLVNGQSEKNESLLREVGDLKARLERLLGERDGERDGERKGREQAETEAALLAQQPPVAPEP